MGTAQNYFHDRDINNRLGIDSEDALWDWVKNGGTEQLASDGWTLTAGEDTFFRGQPNVAFGLSSSLYRLCRYPDGPEGPAVEVTETRMAAVEATVIKAMREEGPGRLLTDGQLLAVLQHHGIPTRLIDVSEGPLEALFFAVNQHHSIDGRLFVIHPHPTTEAPAVDTIDFRAKELPWKGMTYGTRARVHWTERVALVEQAPIDPRMHAQRGRFLVGGLNRYIAGRKYEGVDKTEAADVSTLGINYLTTRTSAPSTFYGATGWTIRIDAAWKPGLLARLASEAEPITQDSMYPPLAGVPRLALRVARDASPRDNPSPTAGD